MTEQPPRVQDLKDLSRADVYKGPALAGHLTRDNQGGVEFRYTKEWVDAGAPPVASSLPVSASPHVDTQGAVPPFFAGLLPEGRRLAALRTATKTSTDDHLTLLLAVGGDTVGDVSIVPEGATPGRVQARLAAPHFATVRFADVRAGLDLDVDNVALPGVQDKVSAEALTVSLAAAGIQVLLKLGSGEFKHIIENEHFFLGAARQAGISTVDAALVQDSVGESALAVTRFDRAAVEGAAVSLAVEDGCQALGIYPAAKYSVTTERVLARLSSLCEAPKPAAAEFLAQAVFAYLSGNGDAHAKNFSVLQDLGGMWRPAPAYDLPSSQPYGDTTLALSVDGVRDGNLTGSRYVALANHLGVPHRAAVAVIDRVADSADAWLDGIHGLPFDHGMLLKLERVIRHRQRQLRER